MTRWDLGSLGIWRFVEKSHDNSELLLGFVIAIVFPDSTLGNISAVPSDLHGHRVWLS